MYKGILVSLEGVNGSGKTTLARKLAQELREHGFRIVSYKFPCIAPSYETTWVDEIVNMIVKEGLTGDLAFLGMIQHFEAHATNIKALLNTHDVVILGRYYHSALVMQEPSQFLVNSRLASALKKGTILKPDLTFVLPMRKREISGGDGFENYEAQFKACTGFMELKGSNIIHLKKTDQLTSCISRIDKIIRKPELPNKTYKTKGNISL